MIFVHCPKTGGTTVTRALESAGVDVVLHGHNPARQIPQRGGREVFGTVRNPWDWAVSWYAWCLEAAGTPALEALTTYGGGSTEWREVLYGITHPTPERTPANWGACFGGCKHWERDAFLASGVGLCTYAHQWAYAEYARDGGAWAVDFLIPTDRLAEGLAEVFCIESGHENARAQRISNRSGLVADFYDAEALDWVAIADSSHNTNLGEWTGPGSSASSPVLGFA